ncbi:unnamed protein product [Brachionus calyciflorus]|uniref:U11/U12 small nuclear ribonucleoprotein 35 kDa protein n=1 Tax=Brachionus calyciflorus TaxID=104777 RepID=A0A813M376_9BILA|nr:unnamed protein product [Brachionus calyciflorus]
MKTEIDNRNLVETSKSEEFSNEEHLKRRNLVIEKNYEFIKDYGFYDPIICGSIDGSDEKPHDHGIIRSINSKYTPNKLVKSDPDRTLFVSGLNYETEEDKLRNYFKKFGTIKSLRIVRDVVTGFSRGYAFVEFKHRSDASKAHHESYKIVIDDRELKVEYELERKLKGWKPRRLGGGLGGYKQSGQLRFGGRYKPFAKIFKTKVYQNKGKFKY